MIQCLSLCIPEGLQGGQNTDRHTGVAAADEQCCQV